MATAPAESSEKGLGLSQSYSNSLDYSGDTFESFSEEESQAGSWCSTEDLEGAAVSEALQSSASLAAQSPAEEESEAVQRAAIGKWIAAMGKGIDVKNKDTGIRPDKSAITAPGIPGFSQDAPRAGKSDTGNSVPAQLLNRILLQNTRQAPKQVTEAEIHEVSTCPECQQKEAELAKAAFLRHKKTLLEGALIQEKLEEQLYSRDKLTLLGEALRSLPKPSEDLWQKLKDQGMKNQNKP